MMGAESPWEGYFIIDIVWNCQNWGIIKRSLNSASITVFKFSTDRVPSYVYTPVGLFPAPPSPIRAANTATSLEIGLQDYGDRRPGPGYPSEPMIVDSELFLKLLAGSIWKVVCNGNFPPLKSLLIYLQLKCINEMTKAAFYQQL